MIQMAAWVARNAHFKRIATAQYRPTSDDFSEPIDLRLKVGIQLKATMWHFLDGARLICTLRFA
jgi:hypothetical protein